MVLAQAGLALLAAAVYAFRAISTATGAGLPDGEPTGAGVVLAAVAALLTVGAAALTFRSARAAAVPLGVVLVAELALLDRYVAPPRLVTALPLVFALALALAPPGARAGRAGRTGTGTTAQRVLSVVSLLMLAPVGFMYLMAGLVVPGLWLLAMYALLVVLVVVAVLLARRGSWWVLAVPPVGAVLWFAILNAGERFLGWTA